ncbi:hypothetical protein ACH5RR_011258 [Cinchona calisaya]|uniref:Uncharacterized protein n=1 Tax=Cinchona calisaya TaxID=153742 RepID=A0ABD3A4D7_9GENT
MASIGEALKRKIFLKYIASILDPRQKFEYVKFVLDDICGSNTNFKKLVKEALYAEYKRLYTLTISVPVSFVYNEKSATGSSAIGMDSSDDDIYSKRFLRRNVAVKARILMQN